MLENVAKSSLLSSLKDKTRLYFLEHISNAYQKEIRYNISQYIKVLQNISIEVETSRSDLDKFVSTFEYAFNNLGVKLNSQEQNSILGAIKNKYLNSYPTEGINSATFYISRPSKDIWTLYGKEGKSDFWLNNYSSQNEIEEIFIDFILEKLTED